MATYIQLIDDLTLLIRFVGEAYLSDVRQARHALTRSTRIDQVIIDATEMKVRRADIVLIDAALCLGMWAADDCQVIIVAPPYTNWHETVTQLYREVDQAHRLFFAPSLYAALTEEAYSPMFHTSSHR